MHHQDTARLDTEAKLRLAFDRGELRTHYQPVLDVATETIIGVEALLRRQHPQRGLLRPGEFIPMAEAVAGGESATQANTGPTGG